MLKENVEARVVVGVDTHRDTHTAAALDAVGRLLGTEEFKATAAGYQKLLRWACQFGQIQIVGIEGTGSYGAGLTRFSAPHWRERC